MLINKANEEEENVIVIMQSYINCAKFSQTHIDRSVVDSI